MKNVKKVQTQEDEIMKQRQPLRELMKINEEREDIIEKDDIKIRSRRSFDKDKIGQSYMAGYRFYMESFLDLLEAIVGIRNSHTYKGRRKRLQNLQRHYSTEYSGKIL